MNDPLVSVSIITYQHERYIRQCLDSVLFQETDFTYEVLVGEDGSTDGTREICREYANRFPGRIRLFAHDRSKRRPEDGRAPWLDNLLNNFRSARGKYIALCEGDDYWTDPRKLQKQVDILEERADIAGVFHDCWVRDEASGEERRRNGNRDIDPEPGVASIIAHNTIPTASMVFRRFEFLVDPPDWFLKVLQGDYGIALLVARQGRWKYIDEAMSVYRKHQGGLWSGMRQVETVTENIKFWTVVVEDPDFARWRSTILARRRQEYLGLAVALSREHRFTAGLVALAHGLGPRRALGDARISWGVLLRGLLRPYLRPAT